MSSNPHGAARLATSIPSDDPQRRLTVSQALKSATIQQCDYPPKYLGLFNVSFLYFEP